MDSIYAKLQAKLDQLAKGFPKTESGEELEILKWFFDPEDAQLFTEMEDRFQTAVELAATTGRDEVATAERLEIMAKKGLVFRLKSEDLTKYRILPMVHGIYEANVKRINQDPVFGKMFFKYFGKYMTPQWNATETPLLRTIPVNSELVVGSEVLPYDDAAAIIKSKRKIAVTDCACRGLLQAMGKRPCDHPLETCLMFDEAADYYVENGQGRYLSIEETLETLQKNEQRGLVINVANSQNPEIMCSCCPCCCGTNVSLKYFKGPSQHYQGNYTCVHDSDECVACGQCEERCPFSANKIKDGLMVFKAERCFGCGLCISTCPQQARTLVRKPENSLYEPPRSMYHAYDRMKKYREDIS